MKINEVNQKVQYTGACLECDYNPAYGVSQCSLENVDLLKSRDFYRSDVLFGDPGSEGPIGIIGVETYKELRANKFKGMDLSAIK